MAYGFGTWIWGAEGAAEVAWAVGSRNRAREKSLV
jgi:hypothetical protein